MLPGEQWKAQNEASDSRRILGKTKKKLQNQKETKKDVKYSLFEASNKKDVFIGSKKKKKS